MTCFTIFANSWYSFACAKLLKNSDICKFTGKKMRGIISATHKDYQSSPSEIEIMPLAMRLEISLM